MRICSSLTVNRAVINSGSTLTAVKIRQWKNQPHTIGPFFPSKQIFLIWCHYVIFVGMVFWKNILFALELLSSWGVAFIEGRQLFCYTWELLLALLVELSRWAYVCLSFLLEQVLWLVHTWSCFVSLVWHVGRLCCVGSGDENTGHVSDDPLLWQVWKGRPQVWRLSQVSQTHRVGVKIYYWKQVKEHSQLEVSVLKHPSAMTD